MPAGPETACSFAAPVAADIPGVKIRDISMTGIGLIMMQRVEIGSRIAIGISNKGHGLAKTAVVRVTGVKPITGGYLVAAEFTTPLTYQEFTSFVL